MSRKKATYLSVWYKDFRTESKIRSAECLNWNARLKYQGSSTKNFGDHLKRCAPARHTEYKAIKESQRETNELQINESNKNLSQKLSQKSVKNFIIKFLISQRFQNFHEINLS